MANPGGVDPDPKQKKSGFGSARREKKLCSDLTLAKAPGSGSATLVEAMVLVTIIDGNSEICAPEIGNLIYIRHLFASTAAANLFYNFKKNVFLSVRNVF